MLAENPVRRRNGEPARVALLGYRLRTAGRQTDERFRPGQLRIRNDSSQVLNITVFGLQPNWSAVQMHPYGAGDAFVAFDPGQQTVLRFRGSLREGYDAGTDTVKVFATVGATNFRWLEPPVLDQPLARGSSVRGKRPLNPLEDMLAASTSDAPPARDLIPAAYPSHEWVSEQIELRVTRE